MRLIDKVVSKDNLNLAYKQVVANKGTSGVDKMTCDEVLEYLKVHGKDLVNQILSRNYQPLPVRRVEIPKPNGGVRKLGVPTVIDRIVQQALVQVLSPIFEPTFSEYSYGFRPGRSCQNAIDKTLEYINSGYEWIVDLDLEKFFDNVNHDKLIRLVDNQVKDSDVTSLTMKFLKAGVMVNGTFEESKVGTPQGGNLSPLLSNIMLNQLDKELERRGLRFARYADDCVIFVKTKYSAERVMRNIVKYIETKLKLKVNATKTHVCRPNDLKYLGFGFWKDSKTKTWKVCPHKDSQMKFKRNLKRLLCRSWSITLDDRLAKLNAVIRGWINYFKKGNMKKFLTAISGWLRTKLRIVIWKQWKVCDKQIKSLVKLGIPLEEAKGLTFCRKGYQFIAHSCVVNRAISNERLKKRGLVSPLEYYLSKIA